MFNNARAHAMHKDFNPSASPEDGLLNIGIQVVTIMGFTWAYDGT